MENFELQTRTIVIPEDVSKITVSEIRGVSDLTKNSMQPTYVQGFTYGGSTYSFNTNVPLTSVPGTDVADVLDMGEGVQIMKVGSARLSSLTYREVLSGGRFRFNLPDTSKKYDSYTKANLAIFGFTTLSASEISVNDLSCSISGSTTAILTCKDTSCATKEEFLTKHGGDYVMFELEDYANIPLKNTSRLIDLEVAAGDEITINPGQPLSPVVVGFYTKEEPEPTYTGHPKLDFIELGGY